MITTSAQQKIPISPELFEAYTNTFYRVADLNADIEIGKLNESMNNYMLQNGKKSFIFITGWNPYSKQLTHEQNLARNKQLETDIKDYVYFSGKGVPKTGDWIPEQSFLVVDITRQQSQRLMEKYEQNAVVAGEVNQKSECIFNSTKYGNTKVKQY